MASAASTLLTGNIWGGFLKELWGGPAGQPDKLKHRTAQEGRTGGWWLHGHCPEKPGPTSGVQRPQLLGHKVLSMSLPPRALVFLPVR